MIFLTVIRNASNLKEPWAISRTNIKNSFKRYKISGPETSYIELFSLYLIHKYKIVKRLLLFCEIKLALCVGFQFEIFIMFVFLCPIVVESIIQNLYFSNGLS